MYKRQVKSIEDLIKSFQELLNSLKKGWEEFKKIIDELFARLKNIKNERRVKPRSNYFNSIADPVADILGAAIKSHPERLKNIMLDLKNKGVEIVFRSDEALGYSPGSVSYTHLDVYKRQIIIIALQYF